MTVRKKVRTATTGEHYTGEGCEVITDACTIYKEDGSILLSFIKGGIPKEVGDVAVKTFSPLAKGKSSLRKSSSVRGNISSNIAGYFDKPKLKDNHIFKNKVVCRLTAFTRNNPLDWELVRPFFEVISDSYRELAPERYRMQKEECEKGPYSIHNTPFSTVTVNHNFQTACHKDKGDYPEGLGNLAVIGDFKGYQVYFPEYHLSVKMESYDLLLMDVHEYHCNLPGSGNRYSFVCYLRNKMSLCNEKIVLEGEEMWVAGEQEV